MSSLTLACSEKAMYVYCSSLCNIWIQTTHSGTCSRVPKTKQPFRSRSARSTRGRLLHPFYFLSNKLSLSKCCCCCWVDVRFARHDTSPSFSSCVFAVSQSDFLFHLQFISDLFNYLFIHFWVCCSGSTGPFRSVCLNTPRTLQWYKVLKMILIFKMKNKCVFLFTGWSVKDAEWVKSRKGAFGHV